MSSRNETEMMVFLSLLCCLVPLLALAAVLFLGIPSFPAALVATLALVPLARALMVTAWGGGRRE